jgi:HD-like signal output (HDOD) protein
MKLADAVSGDCGLATRLIGVANSFCCLGATGFPHLREALMRMAA